MTCTLTVQELSMQKWIWVATTVCQQRKHLFFLCAISGLPPVSGLVTNVLDSVSLVSW